MPHLLKLTFKLAVCGSRVRPGSRVIPATFHRYPKIHESTVPGIHVRLVGLEPRSHPWESMGHKSFTIFGVQSLGCHRCHLSGQTWAVAAAAFGRQMYLAGPPGDVVGDPWALLTVDPCCLMPPYAPAPSPYQDAACKTYGQHSPLAVALIRCRIWAELERDGSCECGAAIDGRNLLCWCLLGWIDTQSWRSCAISFSISFLSLGGNLEVSINGDTPNGWFIIEKPKQKWMIWGYRVSPWLRKPSLRIARSPAGRYLHAHFPLDLEIQVQVRQGSTKG